MTTEGAGRSKDVVIIELRDSASVEVGIAVLALGLVQALLAGAVTVEDTEAVLFKPGVAERLRHYGCRSAIIELIHKGCELRDVEENHEDLIEWIKEIRESAVGMLRTCGPLDRASDLWVTVAQ